MSYERCTLCRHACNVNRTLGELGRCRASCVPYIARIAPHYWEEPILSGERGSGTVFFSGCSLSCVYCQNHEISRAGVKAPVGKPYTAMKLAEEMLKLADRGVHNINFVTPTHHVPTLIESVRLARNMGLVLPIVYNTASYETVETVRSLVGMVDIFLPDYKYHTASLAKELSGVSDYPRAARDAISEMVSAVGAPKFDENGMMRSGVIVRLLLLPGHVADAKLRLSYLYKTYGDGIYISLMSQYTPMKNMKPPLDRPVTRAEYRELVEYAMRLGVRSAFTQEHGVATESFIPPFDLS